MAKRSTGFVPTDETFRIVRSNLLVALADLERSSVIITSAAAGEGKTSVCVGLAQAFARAGDRVVLVDLDLRHPTAHRLLHLDNEVGVSDVLLNRLPVEECLQYKEPDAAGAGLYFLGTGRGIENPAEVLGMGRTRRLLDALALQADLVLIDTPPVLPVADTLLVGRMAAGAMLVIESRRTPLPAVQQARDQLTRNQTRILGVVLNKIEPGKLDGYGYGSGYGAVYASPVPPDPAPS